MASGKAQREIAHGKMLRENNPEHLWGWGTPSGKQRFARRAELLARSAGLKPGMRVLEVGCGTGMFTEYFARTGARIIAVDISPDLLDRARERSLPPEQVTFLCKRFEECEVEGPFDAVVGSSVLHHLDIVPALAKIHGLLKPGGAMSFAEPNMVNPQVFLERHLRFLFSYVSPDETAFVRWRLAAQMRQANFSEVTIVPLDFLHPLVPAPMIGIVSALGNLMERIPVLREMAGSVHLTARRPSR